MLRAAYLLRMSATIRSQAPFSHQYVSRFKPVANPLEWGLSKTIESRVSFARAICACAISALDRPRPAGVCLREHRKRSKMRQKEGFYHGNKKRHSVAVEFSGLAGSWGWVQTGSFQTTPTLSERSNAMFSAKAILW